MTRRRQGGFDSRSQDSQGAGFHLPYALGAHVIVARLERGVRQRKNCSCSTAYHLTKFSRNAVHEGGFAFVAVVPRIGVGVAITQAMAFRAVQT